MKARIITGIVALIFGALGVGISFGVAHLWDDHTLLHTLVQIEAQRQQAAQKATPPAQVVQAPEAK